MNIKEHIEAGHYPTDSKGRPVVPVKCGWKYTILCTDRPGSEPIVGFCPDIPNSYECWSESGVNCSTMNLLPPEPRKTLVVVYGLYLNDRLAAYYPTRAAAEKNKTTYGGRVVELTGELVEEW